MGEEVGEDGGACGACGAEDGVGGHNGELMEEGRLVEGWCGLWMSFPVRKKCEGTFKFLSTLSCYNQTRIKIPNLLPLNEIPILYPQSLFAPKHRV